MLTTNGLVLLPKTILLHWNYFLSFVATDGMDGSGLQLEKIKAKLCNIFQRVDIKSILNGHGLFLLMKSS